MLTRRNLLKSTFATSATAITGGLATTAARAEAEAAATQLRGNIKHSVVSWPFQLFGEKW